VGAPPHVVPAFPDLDVLQYCAPVSPPQSLFPSCPAALLGFLPRSS
jgi:hypothetical protein